MPFMLFMPSHFRYFTFVHNDYLISVFYSRQPVGNNDGCSAFYQFFNGVPDEDFGLGVHAGCRFIQD